MYPRATPPCVIAQGEPVGSYSLYVLWSELIDHCLVVMDTKDKELFLYSRNVIFFSSSFSLSDAAFLYRTGCTYMLTIEYLLFE